MNPLMERNLRPQDPTAVWHGDRIKRLREKKLLTMAALCDLVEMLTKTSADPITLTPGAISRWESGQRRVALRYRRVLGEALGTDHELLFEAPPAGWKPLTKSARSAA